MKRVAIYVRVSTQEQAEEGYSIGAQTERLTAYCKARDWVVYNTYVDPGFSGSNADRPALKRLIADVENNKVDLVLVYKLDRLSRSQKDTLLLIEDVFNKHGVDFVSINENFDTSTSFGRAMVGILSVFAQLEREQIAERMAMGRQERAKEGLWHGGGYDPIGYDYVDGQLVVNEYEAMQIRKAFELFLSGWSLNRVWVYLRDNFTNKHGSWYSQSSVMSVITQPISAGLICYGGEIYPGKHEAIIDPETFKKAQERYESIRWNKKDGKHKKRPFQQTQLLGGLLYCGHCGARYFAKGNYSGRGENRYYRPYYTCYSRAKTNKKLVMDPDCKNKSYAVTDLDALVIGEVKKLSFDPAAVDALAQQRPVAPAVSENEIIEKRIAEVDRQMDRILDLYQLGSMPMDRLSDRLSTLDAEKSRLLEQLVEAVDEGPRVSVSVARDLLVGAVEILDHGSLADRRELVHGLIDKIVIEGEDVVIYWAFA